MKVIAHKGASMEAPENTLLAFQKAIDLKADFIECDVRLTRDKIPVIYHDPINALTYDTIQKWDMGEGEKIPTLKQLLNLNFGKTGLMIEIKELSSLKDLNIITAIIKNHVFQQPYLVGSLLPDIVNLLDPTLPRIGILETMETLDPFLKMNLQVMAVYYQLITPELITKLHLNKIEVWCWTVDDPSFHIKGLDGIITNDVSRFLQIKKSESNGC